jgi:Ran GTPase-activating protein (RanGAP) involved in mRNA processing and transport
LQELALANSIGRNTFHDLVLHALGRLSALQYFDMSGISASEVGVDRLVAVLNQLPNLREIDSDDRCFMYQRGAAHRFSLLLTAFVTGI